MNKKNSYKFFILFFKDLIFHSKNKILNKNHNYNNVPKLQVYIQEKDKH